MYQKTKTETDNPKLMDIHFISRVPCISRNSCPRIVDRAIGYGLSQFADSRSHPHPWVRGGCEVVRSFCFVNRKWLYAITEIEFQKQKHTLVMEYNRADDYAVFHETEDSYLHQMFRHSDETIWECRVRDSIKRKEMPIWVASH